MEEVEANPYEPWKFPIKTPDIHGRKRRSAVNVRNPDLRRLKLKLTGASIPPPHRRCGSKDG
jgi:hypothetical protein